MFLADLPSVLLRWWYLVLAGLLCTGALAVVAAKVVPPTYHATAEVLILPPSTAVPKGGNPYLALGGLNAIGGVLSTALTDNKTVTELKGLGSTGEYSVGLDEASPAPMLVVGADEPTEERALQTVQMVLDRMPGVLRDIQTSASVPQDAYITTTLITKSDKAEAQHKSQLRAVVVAVAVGLVGTLMLTALVNALFPPRRRTRTRAAAPRPSPVAAAAGPEPAPAAHRVESPPGTATPRRRPRVTPLRPQETGAEEPSGSPSRQRPEPAASFSSRSVGGLETLESQDDPRSEYSTPGG